MGTATPGAILDQFILSDRFRKYPHVLSASQADATVLLDADRGIYYTLNEVAGHAWELLVAGEPVIEILQSLGDEYETARATLQTDVAALLAHLIDRTLIERIPR